MSVWPSASVTWVVATLTLASVATTVSLALYDLGERLLHYLEARNLRCAEVVNLSGDREALLAILSADGNSIVYFGDPTLPKASVVAFAAVPLRPSQ